MRGRRAFVALTFYLTLLAGFAWMLEALQASAFQNSGFGGATYQSSQIGTGIFAGLLILQTLLILILAPAFTTGAISQEREKQTLDLLVTTPISSLSIVLGKLFSALAWAFLLVVASIPLTAMVFVFGGVGARGPVPRLRRPPRRGLRARLRRACSSRPCSSGRWRPRSPRIRSSWR